MLASWFEGPEFESCLRSFGCLSGCHVVAVHAGLAPSGSRIGRPHGSSVEDVAGELLSRFQRHARLVSEVRFRSARRSGPDRSEAFGASRSVRRAL